MVPYKRVEPENPPETLPEDFFDAEESGNSSSATKVADSRVAESRGYETPVEKRVAKEPPPPPPPPPARSAPAQRIPEKPKMPPPRKGSDDDLEVDAFLKRLNEVNGDMSSPRRPEPSAPVQRAARAPEPVAAPVRQERAPEPPKPAPAPKPAPVEQELIQVFRSGFSEAEQEEAAPKKKPWVLIGSIAAGVVAVGAAITIPMVMRGKSTPPAPTTTAVTVTPDVQPAGSNTQKPSPSSPANAALPANAANQKQLTTTPTTQPPTPGTVTPQPSVSSESMSQQLNASSQLPQGARNKGQAEPPPSGFGVNGMDAAADTGAIGALKSQSKIKLSPVAVSAGVAGGLLVRRIAPIYPSIAKTARVSGTVVLGATITREGRVANLQVISGPPMLRQAAMDAVKNWLYKPYLLNNQPTEVQTTINVDFSL